MTYSDFETSLLIFVLHAVKFTGSGVILAGVIYVFAWAWGKVIDKVADVLGLTDMMIKLILASHRDRKTIKQ